jgi:magnesium transporter
MTTTTATATATATAVEFDFASRRERAIAAADAAASVRGGLFCWVDIDGDADPPGAGRLLHDLGVDDHAAREALEKDVDGRYDVYDDCLHLGVTSGTFRGGQFVPSHVDVLIGERYFVTLRHGPVEFIEHVRRVYHQDFVKFARTPSFLLYECWDQLIEGYKHAFRDIEASVERVQAQILADVDDRIFNAVAELTRDLLQFRKIVLAAREVLHELSTRRSSFVAESAQPFLEKMSGALERLSADLTVEREVLAETLNLYMGIVSHRTNKVVNRLTVVSMVFLPLTFLCGVYGMNFALEDEATHKNLLMPELTWRYGYLTFWAVAISLATGLLVFMKRRKWW